MIESDAYLCGWRVQSEIPLPELIPWSSAESPVDITIHLGTVQPLSGIVETKRRLTVDTDGHCRLEIPGVCTFSVRNGSEVVIEPTGSTDSLELRNYLFGSVLALICHQRGVFPLHGSCLRLGQSAVVFSGNSGAGKSTLAAALAHRGHRLLSDDVCVIANTEFGWVVHPAFPRVKLHPASLEAVFGASPEQNGANFQGKHHFHFRQVPSFEMDPVPLATIYFLEQAEQCQRESIIDVKGMERLKLIRSQIFRPGMGRELGRQPFLHGTALQLAGAVKVRRLRRSFDSSRIDATIALLEQVHGIPPSPAALKLDGSICCR